MPESFFDKAADLQSVALLKGDCGIFTEHLRMTAFKHYIVK